MRVIPTRYGQLRGGARLRSLALLALVLALPSACASAPDADTSALAACSVATDCAVFDDGDPCTGVWVCAAGTCALDTATVVRCATDKDGLCATNVCDAKTATCALIPRNDGAACEDGDPCTIGDACATGGCKAGVANTCACSVTADCVKREDDDVCNGTLYCDTATFPYQCVVNPATVVICPDGGGCKIASCDPSDGSCSAVSKPDLTACDDGELCTQKDYCAKGSCVGGQNTCTCTTDGDCAAQEDGDLCSGTLYCEKISGSCKVNPTSVVVCPVLGNTACSQRVCQPATGLCLLNAVNQGKGCDDGDACTTAEVCQGGLCAGGTDTCACTADSDCKKAEDGNACNGTLFCNKQNGVCTVNPATVVTCPNGADTACKVNACALATGTCSPTAVELSKQICTAKTEITPETCRIEVLPSGAPSPTVLCDDGDPCTASDTCAKGSCSAGTQVCTCKTDGDCAKTDDGDLCNGVPFCDKGSGTCKPNPATVITCPTVDDTACLKRSCDAKTGKCPLKALENGDFCEDGSACTKGDVCVFGQCNPGANTCECQTNSDCLSKDDGDLCNGVPYCDKTDPKKPACKANAASVVFCLPGDAPCATQVCNPGTGACQPKPVVDGKACDDGTVCTKSSACQGGACKATSALQCDDNNACTFDTCDAKTGCSNVQANCVDGNSCTTDGCDAKTGVCSFPERAKGSPCDADQSGCTIGDSCVDGACKAGPAVVCQLGTKACEQAVCQAKASDAYQCVVAAKGDGAACDDGDVCSLSSTCSKGVCTATPGSVGLFSTGYDPGAGMKGSLRAIAALDGGDYLLGGVITGKSAADASWLLRVGADGKVKWQRKQTAKDGKGAGEIVALLPVSTVAVAALRNQPAGDAYIDVVGLDGKTVVLTAAVKATSGTIALAGGVALADGSLLLGGTRSSGASDYPWAGRVTASGVPMWAGDAAQKFIGRVIQTAAPAGDLVLLGESGVGVGARAWAGQVSPSGKLMWQLALPGHAGDRLTAATRAPGGGLLLVGTRRITTKPRGFMVSLAEDGQVRWLREAPNPSFSTGVVGLGDHGVRIVGRSIVAAKQFHALAIGADGLGNPVFSRTITGAPIAEALAVIGHIDDSVAVVGYQTDAVGQQQGFLWRVGAFGHESCSGQGKCAGKQLADCDDGEPCTANHCAAAIGCVYAPGAGYACDPDDGCHLDGVCAL